MRHELSIHKGLQSLFRFSALCFKLRFLIPEPQ